MDRVRSIDSVCDVAWVRGDAAAPEAAPDLLLEVPHGATLARHFDGLRDELEGDYDDGLRDFFFVNTDVGSPELALAIARGVVAAQPERTAVVVRCELPRTFCDTNRAIERAAVAAASAPGEMTPGLPPWIRHPADRALLLERYFAYREVVEEAFAGVCGAGGDALCVHTYAPRSLSVAVDDDVGQTLRAAYAPGTLETWPLRPEVDLITRDGAGEELANAPLADEVEQSFGAAGFEVARNNTYHLHASTLAHGFARRFPGRTLCFELRRDLLLEAFVPFVELVPRDDKVARAAAPVVAALARGGGFEDASRRTVS
jgi:hypothetical protein